MAKDRYHRAKLIDRIDFTDELALFRFAIDGKLQFKPGQHATLAMEKDGSVLERQYSIASSPHDSFIEFFLELVPDGSLTPRMWHVKRGDAIFMKNYAEGTFTLDEVFGMRRHLMIATVTGIAPFASMIRTQQTERKRGALSGHEFVLIHGASRSAEFGLYKDELSTLARQGWLRYVPTVSRPWEDESWTGEVGRVEDILRKHADALGFTHENAVAYVCGHPEMIENVKNILARARFPKERIREEGYFELDGKTVQAKTQ